jgi:carbamoylphosphate synthase large subunit
MAQHSVLGINRRNLEFIYPNNSRSDFPIADDKALFKEILNEHRVPVPQTYVVIDHLWELDEKVDALKSKEHMVIKPAS